MRVSFLIATLYFALGCGLFAGDVLVVQGTSSMPDDAERRYAGRIAAMMGRFLDGLGAEWTMVTDDEITESVLRRYKVAVLPYNTKLPSGEMTAIRSYVSSGGKLMVFYSADESLAALMGFRLGPYESDDVPKRFCGVRSAAEKVSGFSGVFYQESRNIRPVYPAADGAIAAAFWEDSQGRKTEFPAIAAGPAGMWMSHVLLDDMDEQGKKRMLLGFLSRYAAGIERKAAEKVLSSLDAPGSLASFELFLAAVKDGAGGRAVKYFSVRRDRLADFYRAGRYSDCISGAEELLAEMASVYARARLKGRLPRMGVWDHTGWGLYPGSWARTTEALKNSGVTDIYVNLLWPWEAHFKSAVVAESRPAGVLGDQAAAAIEAAHASGIKVHLWKVCWNVESAPAEVIAGFKRQGRLQVDADGNTVNWLCPSSFENIRMEKDALRDALKKYAFDGVHLDYIRFRDSKVCYCVNCKNAFEGRTGIVAADWPKGARIGSVAARYSQWRVGQISGFVRDIDAMVSKLRPEAEMSAAVFGKYPSCVPSVAQDWVSWLRDGYLDYVCPMNYTEDPVRFDGYVASQAALTGNAGMIHPGIGLSAAESRLDAFDLIDQIRIAGKHGCGGFVVFDLNRDSYNDLMHIVRSTSSVSAGKQR